MLPRRALPLSLPLLLPLLLLHEEESMRWRDCGDEELERAVAAVERVAAVEGGGVEGGGVEGGGVEGGG